MYPCLDLSSWKSFREQSFLDESVSYIGAMRARDTAIVNATRAHHRALLGVSRRFEQITIENQYGELGKTLIEQTLI